MLCLTTTPHMLCLTTTSHVFFSPRAHLERSFAIQSVSAQEHLYVNDNHNT